MGFSERDDFRPSSLPSSYDSRRRNNCNCFDNNSYENFSSTYSSFRRGQDLYPSDNSRDLYRSSFDEYSYQESYRSPFSDVNRGQNSYRSPFNDPNKTDGDNWSPFNDSNRSEDTYRSPFNNPTRSEEPYRSPFEDRTRTEDSYYDVFEYEDDAYNPPFNGFRSEDVYRSPSGNFSEYRETMPSSSWRSRMLPSCSVAELQEIADGVSGFTLPTEPVNEVYPRVYLGDA